ncbi:MAG: hypothetical protein CM1200mP2_31600 [Planctomycetaceae bacterium]|nr:MAG: hypothetical protein CM1200mP2_31600 [Planctomycetaceae bacterium]
MTPSVTSSALGEMSLTTTGSPAAMASIRLLDCPSKSLASQATSLGPPDVRHVVAVTGKPDPLATSDLFGNLLEPRAFGAVANDQQVGGRSVMTEQFDRPQEVVEPFLGCQAADTGTTVESTGRSKALRTGLSVFGDGGWFFPDRQPDVFV